MLMMTHLVITLLIIHILRLDENEAFIALTFGVLIDLDHLFGYYSYLSIEGASGAVSPDQMLASEVQWKSMLHSTVALFVVAPLSLLFRYMIPLVVWGVHISMDYVQEAYLGITSMTEMALLAAGMVLMVHIRFRDFRNVEPAGSAGEFALWEAKSIVGMFTSILPDRVRQLGKAQTV